MVQERKRSGGRKVQISSEGLVAVDVEVDAGVSDGGAAVLDILMKLGV